MVPARGAVRAGRASLTRIPWTAARGAGTLDRVGQAGLRAVATAARGGLQLWSGGSVRSYRCRASVLSHRSVGSVASSWSMLSAGSWLSIGSAGSILSIGSAGSILSIGSTGSILSIGASGGFLSVPGATSAPEDATEPLPFVARPRLIG